MSLTAGTKLGNFEIADLIGIGGMGEVYRARDTRLGRDVAIKVLPAVFAQDAERMQRFEREARLLASLTHPNIATLHEFRSENDTHFLVMELVGGETLSERLARGAIPVHEVIPIFEQIAEALEAAHEQGIVHRDLKPGNIKLAEGDRVKVLDFGLAKSFADDDPASPPSSAGPDATTLPATPTPPTSITATEMLLGTPGYMSPEQARGKRVDKRADVWAFGCCLYESLVGKKVFDGDSIADKLSAITRDEPDWDALPKDLPGSVRDLLERCLRKDPQRRLRDMSFARVELQESLSRQAADREAAAAPARPQGRMLLLGLGALAAVVALTLFFAGDSALNPFTEQAPQTTEGFALDPEPPQVQAPKRVRRIAMTLSPDAPLADSSFGIIPVAISRDGSQLVYVTEIDGIRKLVTRRMDRFDSTVLEGTDGASNPFFSPDGRFIAFLASNSLMKVRTTGGAPVVLATTSFPALGFWDDDDYIYFSLGGMKPIHRVPAAGGTSEPVTVVPGGTAGNSHFFPHMLPGKLAMLYTRAPGPDVNLAQIVIRRFEDNQDEVLAMAAAKPIYTSTGHIVFVQEGRLSALPFDLDTLKPTGPVADVTEAYMSGLDSVPMESALSDEGTLVYVPGGADTSMNVARTLVWVDRDGNESPINAPPRPYYGPRLSRDGKRMVVDIRIPASAGDIWVLDLNRGTLTRVTTHESQDMLPGWHPDGRHIVFSSNRSGGTFHVYQTFADGTSEATALTDGDQSHFAPSFTPDATAMLVSQLATETNFDVYILTLDGSSEPTPLIATQFREGNAEVSPDGKWLAYASEGSGRAEVYVQAFPELRHRVQISVNGGIAPVWAPDGTALYFQSPTAMMRVDVTTSPAFEAGIPEALFEDPYYRDPAGSRSYDVSPIDGRFIMLRAASEEDRGKRTELMLVENWFEELKRLAPPDETP